MPTIRISIALLMASISSLVFAHGGGVGANGCHNETSTGKYHCHQGTYQGMTFDSQALGLAWIAAHPNEPPTIVITGGDRSIPDSDGLAGETVTLNYTLTDGENLLDQFEQRILLPNGLFQISQGAISQTVRAPVTLFMPTQLPDGVNIVTISATDKGGLTGSAIAQITVVAPASPPVDPPEEPSPEEEDETYDRDEYLPYWADNDDDCINTRHEVLLAESRIPVTMSENGCSVIAGEWYDPYTDTVFTDPGDLDVDHLVPLYEAHISGAAEWSIERKREFANDLADSAALIAVDASANRSKGSDDPALWLPPNESYHCEYVRNWVGVKNAYGLSIDEDELETIEFVLGDDIAHVSGFTQFGYQVNGEPTAARISMGWTKNDGCAMYTEATAQDLLDLSVTIVPREEDSGRPFNFYILPVINGQLYTFTSTGMLIPIDVDPAQIIPFASSTFDSNFQIDLFQGYVGAGFLLDLFLAYWVENGDLIFTATPIRIQVQ